jgi:hypothetical protein
MFVDILFNSLKPLLQVQYSEEEIYELSVNIAQSIEINPREGSNISFLRDSVLNYINSPEIQQRFKDLNNSRLESATKIKNLNLGISQLETLSSIGLKSALEGTVTDQTLAKEIYNLNFGYKQNLGEIIYQVRHNQGGKLGF